MDVVDISRLEYVEAPSTKRKRKANIQGSEIRTGSWTLEELTALRNVVSSYLSQIGRIDWNDVTATLKRSRHDCDIQWNRIRKKEMKSGNFSPEEDALIIQRVIECKEKENIKGLWKGLERELNRTTWSIGYRWTAVLAKQVAEANVTSSIEAFSDSASAGRMAEQNAGHFSSQKEGNQVLTNCVDNITLGQSGGTTGTNSAAKKRRWVDFTEPVAVRTGAWTPDEVDQLMEFVAYQECEFEAIDNVRKGKFKVNWAAIGRRLNRDKDVCYNKHKAVMRGKLKKTDFSPEEDALILRRLAEWGHQGHGMWAAIGKELGRDGVNVQVRYSTALQSKSPTPGSASCAHSHRNPQHAPPLLAASSSFAAANTQQPLQQTTQNAHYQRSLQQSMQQYHQHMREQQQTVQQLYQQQHQQRQQHQQQHQQLAYQSSSQAFPVHRPSPYQLLQYSPQQQPLYHSHQHLQVPLQFGSAPNHLDQQHVAPVYEFTPAIQKHSTTPADRQQLYMEPIYGNSNKFI